MWGSVDELSLALGGANFLALVQGPSSLQDFVSHLILW